MCFKSNIRLGHCLLLYRLVFQMNGADSEPRHQLPTTAIKMLFSNQKQYVHIGSSRSKCTPIELGVPQGSIIIIILIKLYFGYDHVHIKSNTVK